MKKRALSLLLMSVLLLALFPAASAAPAAAGEGVGQIKNGDIILLGRADEAIGFTGKWIVLDAAHTNTGDEGMFLLSKDLIGSDAESGMLFRAIEEDVVVSFDDRGEAYAAEHPDVLSYQGSDIQRWCGEFLADHFSQAEQNALFQTYKSDGAYQVGLMMDMTVDFDPAEEILNGDQIFLLSAEEATNPDYGFADNGSRMAALNGTDAMWWLRSPHTPSFPLDVGLVFTNGMIMDFPVHGRMFIDFDAVTCARPACNLDMSKVTAVQEVGREKNGAAIWSLTLAEDGEGAQIQAPLPDGTGGYAPPSVGIFPIILIIAIPVVGIGVVVTAIVLIVKRVRKKRRAKG